MRRLQPPAAFALLAALCAAAACEPDPVARSCADFCDHRAECDGSDAASCTDDCIAAAGDCQADEQDQALDDLDACAVSSCDELALCTIGAGLTCYLGL